jgi:hypothetical protein
VAGARGFCRGRPAVLLWEELERMRKAGSPSWRFVEDEAQFLHLALFVRDATGLAVERSDDIPPHLAGDLPGQAGVLAEADRGTAAGQWAIWWRRLLAQAARESERERTTAGDLDPLTRVQAIYAGREEVLDPPRFGSLADLPQLHPVAAAVFADADRWWSTRDRTVSQEGGAFAWRLVRDAAEDAAAELGIPIGDVTAATYVLDVEGAWSYLAAPGFALCSVPVATDPPAARQLLHDVFTTGRGDPALAGRG